MKKRSILAALTSMIMLTSLVSVPVHAASDSILWKLHTATALGKTDNNFEYQVGDYNRDGKSDLYAIKKSGTSSGKTEVYILNGANNYQSFLLSTSTVLEKSNSNYSFRLGDYNKDGILDIYVIKKSGTSSKKTEVHILNGADNFKSYLLHTSTALGETDINYDFQLGDYNRDGKLDLYAIKKSGTGTGKTEVHVLNGANNFQSFLLHIGTALGQADSKYNFQLGDYNNDGIKDIYCIKKSGTSTNSTEIQVLNGANNYQSFLLQTKTPLEQNYGNFQFVLGSGKLDLYCIKMYGTSSGKTEVHVLGESEDVKTNAASSRTKVVNEAMYWIGKIPYKTPSSYNYLTDVLKRNAPPVSMDCSDFTSAVYATALGIRFPDYTGSQLKVGTAVSKTNALKGNYSDLLPGDLIIFDWTTNGYTADGDHVGMYIGNGQIINERGSNSRGGNVKITSLDENWGSLYGIVRSNILAIRRVIQ